MALDVKKWLIDEMGFSEAEATEMLPKFTGERVSRLEQGYVAGSERATIAANRVELDKTQAELKRAGEKLNAEITEWATLTASEKAQATELQQQLEASQLKVFGLQQTVRRVATEAGIDPEKVLPKEAVVEPVVKPQPTVDLSQYVKADQYSALAQFQLELPAQLQYIADEHRALTGKNLDTRTIVAEIRRRSGDPKAVIDPVRIWEEQHGIAALRETRATDDFNAKIAAAEARGEERARTNMEIPGAHVSRSSRPSPVLSHRNDQGQFAPRESILKRPTPMSGVMSAAQALRSGKYAAKATA